MTKVSKNLKKIRTAKNLTQDALAEKLFVTRQTVSSWENDRTQPDIETLVKISEVLGVEIEELIYGEKRFSSAEEKTQNTKRTLIVVFSIIASILTGVGLILIFVTGWEKFPEALKAVFAFVPMLAGQAAAVFTYLKHKDSVAWREGASVLWCAGIAATVALVNSVFDVNGGFQNCLLADTLMFLPVIYILDAVTPLVVYYTASIYYSIYLFETGYELLPVAVMFLLYFAGLVYVIINRKKTEDIRHIYTLWISVLAAFAGILINVMVVGDDYPEVLSVVTAFFLCLYAADKNGSWARPYTPLGLLGLSAVSVTSVFLFDPDMMSEYKVGIGTVVILSLCVAAVVVCAVFGRKSFEKNIGKIVYGAFAAAFLLTEIICSLFLTQGNTVMYVIILFTALGMSLSLVAHGALSGRFVQLNLGLVAAAVMIGYMIVRLIDIGVLEAGIMLILFGLILFAVNFFLARKTKNTEKEEK